jgi:hypothetical protein
LASNFLFISVLYQFLKKMKGVENAAKISIYYCVVDAIVLFCFWRKRRRTNPTISTGGMGRRYHRAEL